MASINSYMTTRYGRIVKKPQRHADKEYTKGSGFKGCDHYDSGYSGFEEQTRDYTAEELPTQQDINFIDNRSEQELEPIHEMTDTEEEEMETVDLEDEYDSEDEWSEHTAQLEDEYDSEEEWSGEEDDDE